MPAESKPLFLLTITVPNLISQELASYELHELGQSSCELSEAGDEDVEGTGFSVTVYSENRDLLTNLKKELLPQFDSIVIADYLGPDWREEWKRHLKPVQLAGDFWVTPPWTLPPRGEHPDNIVIQPQMAFGTGHHASTRLAAIAMHHKKTWLEGKRFLDLGAGSGIQILLANNFGCSYVLGVEKSLDCLGNIRENQNLNQKVALPCVIGELLCIRQEAKFDLCCINMIRTRSLPLIKPLSAHVKPGGYIVWSGLDLDEAEKIKQDLDAGLFLEKEFTEGEWWCGLLKIEP